MGYIAPLGSTNASICIQKNQFIRSDLKSGGIWGLIALKKMTTKDILALLQILFHIPSKRSMGLVESLFGICRTRSAA
jgi:hypothetical protein